MVHFLVLLGVVWVYSSPTNKMQSQYAHIIHHLDQSFFHNQTQNKHSKMSSLLLYLSSGGSAIWSWEAMTKWLIRLIAVPEIQTYTHPLPEDLLLHVNLKCARGIVYLCILMAYFHCRTRIWTPIVTLYYAELFPLLRIRIQIPIQMVSRMVTLPILGTDLHPRDRCLSQFYYISIRGSESKSKPVEKSCIVQESMSESESEPGIGNKP